MTSWVEAVIDRNYAKLIKHLEVEIQVLPRSPKRAKVSVLSPLHVIISL